MVEDALGGVELAGDGVVVATGRTVKMGDDPRSWRRGPGRRADRAVAPPLLERLDLLRDLSAHEDVQAIAGADPRGAARGDRLVSSDDHADERVARQPEVAHVGADDGVVGTHRVLDGLGAEAADHPDLDDRLGRRRLGGRLERGLRREQPAWQPAGEHGGPR